MTLPSNLQMLYSKEKIRNYQLLDFLFYVLGVNLIPAITVLKSFHKDLEYKRWLTSEQSAEDYEKLKSAGMFDQGLALVPYKLWRGKYAGKHLLFIDCDNQLAIRELCIILGKIMNKQYANLQELSEDFIVEQHTDDLNRAHVYIIVDTPLADKNSTKVTQPSLISKLESGEIPSFEIRCNGKGTAFCSPSIHKNGHVYEILRTNIPKKTLDAVASLQLQTLLNQMLKGYGLGYLEPSEADDNNNKNNRSIVGQIPIEELEEDDTVIYEGNNRHLQLQRIFSSKLQRYAGKKSFPEIMSMVDLWNQEHCRPPLSIKELEKSGRQSLRFVIDTANGSNIQKRKKEFYIQKYSDDTILAEAVIIDGKSYFLVVCNNDDSNSNDSSSSSLVSIQEFIELNDKILKPLEEDAYLSKPYNFASEQQVREYIDSTKNETLDTLYKKVKSICQKYIDADDFHLSILSADIIYTYFQDKLGLTHYLFFIGDNTSGKSNNLRVIHTLAYRNFMSTDLTAANIYQFLGSFQEGQGTLCIDEADDIDSNTDVMRIFKNGYTSGFPVARLIDNPSSQGSGKKQYRFFTFGFKAFSAERLPDSITAKGFNQRIIPLPCTFGNPQYDISEVLNPAGEEEHHELVEELTKVRNTLLIFRLLHYHHKIPDIKLNLTGREKQLFKPVIRVFQSTSILKGHLLKIISKYVSQRRESNANSLHAFLYKVIIKLINEQNASELPSSLIWDNIINQLPGSNISNRPLSYESSEFGTISQKGIVEILIQVFGAKQSLNRQDKRKLIFDLDKLKRLGRIYELSIQVKVGTSSTSSTSDFMTDTTDLTDIGLDKHLGEETKDEENTALDQKSLDVDNQTKQNNENIISTKKQDNAPLTSGNPSQMSHPSSSSSLSSPLTSIVPKGRQMMVLSSNEKQKEREDDGQNPSSDTSAIVSENAANVAVDINNISSIYRIGNSDIWACPNCKVRDDIWFMRNHPCSISKKKKKRTDILRHDHTAKPPGSAWLGNANLQTGGER
jgi:hypothetical protein